MDLRISFLLSRTIPIILSSAGPQTGMKKSWASSLQDLGGSLTVGLSAPCNVRESYGNL